jgi:hypothetical protein
MKMVPRSARIWSRQPQIKAFMKFVTLTRKRAHVRGESNKLPRTAPELSTKPRGGPHPAHTYSELRQQIHDDLRIQHPEWIQPTGECPLCDAYEARLMELLDPLRPKADNKSVAAPDRSLEHGLN